MPSLFARAWDGSALPLALVVAGAWLSNAPLGVIASYLLAILAVTQASLLRSWAPLLRAATGVFLGLALTAAYLVPAAWEQRWVAIDRATVAPGDRIPDNWLFERQPGASLSWHDRELLNASVVALAMLALAFGAILFVRLRHRDFAGGAGIARAEARRWWIPIAFIPPIVLLLQLPISLPLWNLLPKLRFLQFPWRWMIALEAPMAVYFAAAVWSLRPRLRSFALAASALVCIGATAIAGHTFFLACGNSIFPMTAILANYGSGAGFGGTPEYSLPDFPFYMGTPAAVPGPAHPCQLKGALAAGPTCDRAAPVQLTRVAAPYEHLTATAVSDRPGYLVLRLRSYPAWQITVNGQPAAGVPRPQDGLVMLPVPAGASTVDVRWSTTSDVRLGRWIALSACVLLLALWIAERRHRAIHLSS